MIKEIKQYEQFKIKRIHSNERPNKVLYFDTETKTRVVGAETHHRMKIAWTCYYEKRSSRSKDTTAWLFWDEVLPLNQYIESLCKDKTVLYIFAHNIFFDLQCSDFFYYFTKEGWVLDFHYDKGMTYILTIHKGKKRIRCLSTTNFYPVSLKKLGKMVGLPKLDVDFNEDNPEKLKVYCRRDVEILKATMEGYWAFLDKHDLGKFVASRAGQAFIAYRHRFMLTDISVHRDEDISEFERESYFGGRVECGFIGKASGGPFVSLDVNSMYPYVMRTFRYPTQLHDEKTNPSLSDLKMALRTKCVIARVYLNTDEPAYPVKHNNRLVFPVGQFPCVLCTESLRYAIEKNHLVKIGHMSTYKAENIFANYVDYFYDLKVKYSKEKNKIMTTLAKYFLNCLYGKFGQKSPLIEEEEEITYDGYYREESLDLVTGKTEVVTKLFNKLFITYGEKTASNSFVAVASHVTDNARLLLYSLMRCVGLDNVLYCDTDSLKIRTVHEAKLSEWLDQYELGKLKAEDRSDTLDIRAPKDYATDNECKIKGVPKSSIELRPGTYKYTNFPRQTSHLRKQITRYYITVPITKTLKRKYTKGVVLASGVVRPLKLNVPPGF